MTASAKALGRFQQNALSPASSCAVDCSLSWHQMLRSLLKSALSRPKAQHAVEAPALRLSAPFVAFVTPVPSIHQCHPSDSGFSALASARLRVLMPAKALAASVPVVFVPIEYAASDPTLQGIGQARAIVLGKLSAPMVLERQHMLEGLLAELPDVGRRIPLYADLSDDYAAIGRMVDKPFLEHYQRTVASACELTVPCQALADRLAGVAGKGIHVIEDPWESPRANPPREALRDPLRVCWFGTLGPVNISVVESGLLQIAKRLAGKRVVVDVVTGEIRRELVRHIGERLFECNPLFTTRFVPWSLEATWRAIEECDVVALPQERGEGMGNVKSHNRLVETIRGGRLAVASPIPSYQELADYAWLGEDLGEGVAWALEHPQAARERVAAGQAHITERFSPEVVGRKWAAALGIELAVPALRAPGRVGGAQGARLNLGCGDKILPDYVNVDVAPTRAGKAPDVLCDLRNLAPFETGSCDEVLAVHVVEHFWRWEVVDVLREWVRVLRPGGRMVLECPNLLTACEELLRDPVAGARTGAEGQRTMWVFYGDPAWQDPLMCHRWNYTPQSLREVMEEAGLANVRQEPAQFKLREPRDMRLVGEKPAS